jgi:hypothetical protein
VRPVWDDPRARPEYGDDDPHCDDCGAPLALDGACDECAEENLNDEEA